MMLNSLLVGLRGQAAVQAEIIALRHQLTVRTRVRIEFLDSTRFEDFDASRVRCDLGPQGFATKRQIQPLGIKSNMFNTTSNQLKLV
jgi:hypothetical protein